MKTKNSKSISNQKGISLVEVLVVLVVSAILITVAIAGFGNAETRFETQNIARELKINFERARFDSVKRRPTNISDMSRVVINDATSFSVSLDRDQSNTLEVAETMTVSFGDRNDVKIIADGMAFPVTIAFDRKGHITAVDNNGNTVTPTFIICDNCTSNTVTANNSFTVAVSPTGTVTMLKNGETLPSHSNPATTNVSDTYEIDTMLTIQNGVIPNGTPVPTPTPDPTPSPLATPTPTPAPTPANPTVCVRNERPHVTGCICQSPFVVHSNGQCK